MNTQERNRVEEIIQQVKQTGKDAVITLEEYPVLIFRNLFHTAKNLEPGLDAEVVEKGKSFRIFKTGG